MKPLIYFAVICFSTGFIEKKRFAKTLLKLTQPEPTDRNHGSYRFRVNPDCINRIPGSITLVTTLYDIGRGNWTKFRRPISEYKEYFMNLLSFSVNLFVVCDKATFNFVRHQRLALQNRTYIHLLPFEKTEYFQYKKTITKVMRSNQFKFGNQMLTSPEGFSSDYVILMSNKVSFLKRATELNPFCSSHFYWIDAGYGQGGDVFPALSDLEWNPRKLIENTDRITYIALQDPNIYRNIKNLHKINIMPALSGGFFGGQIAVLKEFENLFKKQFKLMLKNSIVDDDQNIALKCYFVKPSLFRLERGSWFDAFRLFF